MPPRLSRPNTPKLSVARSRTGTSRHNINAKSSCCNYYTGALATVVAVCSACWVHVPQADPQSKYNLMKPAPSQQSVAPRTIPATQLNGLGLAVEELSVAELTVDKLSISANLLPCATSSGYDGSSEWLCVRPAKLRATWASGAFGFSAAESARAAAEGMCWQDGEVPVAYETEASTVRRRQWRPKPLTRSRLGFQILRIPDPLLQVLRTLHARGNRTIEARQTKYCQSNHLFQDAPHQWHLAALGSPEAMTLDEFVTGSKDPEMIPVRNWIAAVLQQVVEDWQGRLLKLQLVYYYGLRIYAKDAMMVNHRDDARNRILGVVMQVAQDVDEGWPLYIEDSSRGSSDEPEYFELFLQPGTMVLYEAARLTHGRPRRLRGRSFVNAFIHFKPSQTPAK